MLKPLVGMGAAMLLTLSSAADPFQNGSFEEGDYVDSAGGSFMSLPAGSHKITGWTVGGTDANGIDWKVPE